MTCLYVTCSDGHASVAFLPPTFDSIMFAPTPYGTVRALMQEENWDQLDKMLQQQPDTLYTTSNVAGQAFTPLKLAVHHRYIPAIRHLLQRGATVNETRVESTDGMFEATPVMIYALMWNTSTGWNQDRIKLLDVLAKEGDFNPLAMYKFDRCCNSYAIKGTLLHYVARQVGRWFTLGFDEHVFAWLVAHDVPLDARDARGMTAYDIWMSYWSESGPKKEWLGPGQSRDKEQIREHFDRVRSILDPGPKAKNANT